VSWGRSSATAILFGLVLGPLASGQEPRAVLSGHSQRVEALAFSPDGRTLATSGPDRTLRFWEVETGQPSAFRTGFGPIPAVIEIPTEVEALAFCPQAASDPLRLGARKTPEPPRVVVVGADRSLTLWDVESGAWVAPLVRFARPVVAISYDSQGILLAAEAWDDQNRARLWEVASGVDRAVTFEWLPLRRSIAFAPDGRFLAFGDESGTVTLRDLPSGAFRTTLSGHEATVWSLCVSPDGTTLVTGDGRGRVCLWDIHTGTKRAELDAHSGAVSALAVSPDGRTLATGGADQVARLWDLTEVLSAGPRQPTPEPDVPPVGEEPATEIPPQLQP
jgi:WD40 repeat protein